MEHHRDSAPLAGSHLLPSGERVRLRLAQRGDGPAIAALLATCAVEADELTLARLLHHDPRSHAVVCATTWSPAGERLVAIGAVELVSGAQPELLICEPGFGDELTALLTTALAERVRARVA